MSPATRSRYFGLWTAACRAQHWDRADQELRHQVTRQCMEAVGGSDTDSTSDPRFRADEVTALFTFLEFLGQESLEASARWLDCQTDYRAFNRARQAAWHERQLYGDRKNKPDRDRFHGVTSAQNQPLDRFDPDEARKRHLTMVSRHQKKFREQARGCSCL